jgi:hypothetical protein
MSLARQLILHPEHFEECVRGFAQRFVARHPLQGWRGFDCSVYRPEISHPLHVAGRSREELNRLKAIAKRIFREESPIRSNATPGPPRKEFKNGSGLPEHLYAKK